MDDNQSLTKAIQDSEAHLAKLRFHVAVEEQVLARLRGFAGNAPAQKTATSPKTITGSLADHAVTALREAGRPMRAADIASVLRAQGISSNSKAGILPSLISALRRRADLFRKVRRGVYTLVTKESEGDESCAKDDKGSATPPSGGADDHKS